MPFRQQMEADRGPIVHTLTAEEGCYTDRTDDLRLGGYIIRLRAVREILAVVRSAYGGVVDMVNARVETRWGAAKRWAVTSLKEEEGGRIDSNRYLLRNLYYLREGLRHVNGQNY